MENEKKPRYINAESNELIQTAKEIIETFYSEDCFANIYKELEKFQQILELINAKKEGGVSTETSIGLLTYASTYAAHTRPKMVNKKGG